jgi:hypothetical protein
MLEVVEHQQQLFGGEIPFDGLLGALAGHGHDAQ